MKQKCISGITEVIVLAVVLLLSLTALNTEYLFQWAAHNWKFYLISGAVAVLLVFFNKQFISAFMTGGIVIGICVGNFLGSSIKRLNESKIVEGMKAEQVHRLHHHPGFEIWMGIILLSIVIGIIMQIIVTQKRRKV